MKNILTNYRSLTFTSFHLKYIYMFERQKIPVFLGKFLVFSKGRLFQMVRKFWCKSGVNGFEALIPQGLFTPIPSIIVGRPGLYKDVCCLNVSPISILVLQPLGKGQKQIRFLHGAHILGEGFSA